jgi:hypothetical protein
MSATATATSMPITLNIEERLNTNDVSNFDNIENIDNVQEKITRFGSLVTHFYKGVDDDFKKYLDNPKNIGLLKTIYKKYPHLSRGSKLTKRTKRIEAKAFVQEILESDLYKDDEQYKFTRDEKKIIYTYCVKKIKGIYKHAQALKTGYCNLLIINGFSEENTISICVTKDTLEANEQWLQRLFKELDKRFPHRKLNDKIMVISSKKKELDGHATHCKDINSAWKILKRPNDIKIIFVCSNKTRISDILDISLDFQNLNISLQKNLRILHDEAHNLKEGIPAHREIVENIILQPNVLSYTPITASNKSLFDLTNPIWIESNCENQALNYTSYDKTKSTDPNYSACSKAIRKTIEELKTSPYWKDFEIDKISQDIFMNVHGDDYEEYNSYSGYKLREKLSDEIDLFVKQNIETTEFDITDIIQDKDHCSNEELIKYIKLINMERRRTLEFCGFMENNREIEAVNSGLNWLNMNQLLGVEFFKQNEFNMHLLSTPNRKIITRFLCLEAIRNIEGCIVLGIYGNEGNKYHLLNNGTEQEVSDIMGNGEFNDKLDKLFTYLKLSGINLDVPFVIIGNYIPTGESLTYVSCSYGTLRSNARLISTNAEEDYQQAARGNFMLTRFIQNNPNWIAPEKYLIGPEKFIDNALSYELENDARIDDLLLRNENDTNNNNEIIVPSDNNQSLPDAGGLVAVPIKITISGTDPEIVRLHEILEKKRRSEEDKVEFLDLLQKCHNNEEIDCEIDDKSNKFISNWGNYTIKDLRCYKKPENGETGPKKGVWKFANYQNHYNIGTSFINSINNIKVNECEILTCKDSYILKDESGNILEKNNKSVWWMGYKY